MNIKKVIKLSLISALAITIMLAFGACGGKDGGTDADKNDKSKTEEEGKALKQAYDAYYQILTKNEQGIRAYGWQRDPGQEWPGESGGINRQTALADVNRDGIPEFFYLTRYSDYGAALHICKFNAGKAEDMNYGGFEKRTDQTRFCDDMVAGGFSYVVYTGKTKGELYIYYSVTDESVLSVINKYKMNKDGSLELIETLYNSYGPDDYHRDILDIYRRNGKDISAEDGKKAFSSAFSNLDKAVIYSGNTNDKDNSIWKNFKPDEALSISYDDMVKKLSQQ